MNKRTIAKAALDAAMAVSFLLLMNTAVTGIPLHEIMGVAIPALFAAHLAVNRKGLGNIFRRLRQGTAYKQKSSLMLNAALAVSTSACVVTGVMISQLLFAPVGRGSSSVWYDVHAISAWVSLCLLVPHGALHRRWIAGVLRQVAERAGRVKAFAARAGAGLLAAGAVYSLFAASPVDRLLPPASPGTPVELIGPNREQQAEAAISAGPTAAQTSPTVLPTAQHQADATLEEYLSKLFCTACHKRCPLTNPRCGHGEQQAEEAAQEYNETYANSDT